MVGGSAIPPSATETDDVVRDPMARFAGYLVEFAVMLAERRAGSHGASATPIRRWRGRDGRLLLLARRRIPWPPAAASIGPWLRTTRPLFTHRVGVVLEAHHFREWVRPGR
jgi:hypothetical protein